MHELSIIQNILPLIERVAAENHMTSVKKVTLKVGRLRQIVPEFLKFAFESVTKTTVAEGAELIVESVPILVLCKSCQQQFVVEENIYLCPNCNHTDLQVLTGKEIILESIEGE